MANRLQSKVAIITGGSSGFGRASAVRFAAEGAKVVIADIKQEANPGGFEAHQDQTVFDEINAIGGEATFIRCDVTKAADVAAMVSEAVATYGRLDIMFNNAGIYRFGKLAHEFTEEDLDACWNINLKGTWFGAQEAVKQFRKQGGGGNIINLVSTAGLQGHPRQSVYNISKGAQANLTRCLAIEYGHEGIRVNGICPTYCKTSMARSLFDDETFRNTFSSSVPLQRWGEMSDVANLAVFLASDESSYIHGDLVRIDGGETLCRYSV